MNCPLCGDNTRPKTKKRPERCPVETCAARCIIRNNRGDAWVWDHEDPDQGRLRHKPNRHPEPVDQGPTCLAPLPPPPDYDGFQITNHGTIAFGRRNRETST